MNLEIPEILKILKIPELSELSGETIKERIQTHLNTPVKAPRINYMSIDPKIRSIIRLLNSKGITTADSCAGVGPSVTYSGRIQSHTHALYYLSPYFTVLTKETSEELLDNLIYQITGITVKTKLSSYPVPLLSPVEHSECDDICKATFRINRMFWMPLEHKLIKTIKRPSNFLNYWQNRWLNTVEKIVEEL